jgi:hypothetical protein
MIVALKCDLVFGALNCGTGLRMWRLMTIKCGVYSWAMLQLVAMDCGVLCTPHNLCIAKIQVVDKASALCIGTHHICWDDQGFAAPAHTQVPCTNAVSSKAQMAHLKLSICWWNMPTSNTLRRTAFQPSPVILATHHNGRSLLGSGVCVRRSRVRGSRSRVRGGGTISGMLDRGEGTISGV